MMSSNPSRNQSMYTMLTENPVVREYAQRVKPHQSGPAYIAAQCELAAEEKKLVDSGEIEPCSTPKAEKDKFFGVPKRVVSKNDFMVIRPLGLHTTVSWGSTEKCFIHLTEEEAIVWHQREGTVYERKKGGSVELDREVEKNLERYRKRIHRLIRGGIQKRGDDENDWEDGALKDEGLSIEDDVDDGQWVKVSSEGKFEGNKAEEWVKC
ncbi:hypothetical protein VTL71DRAFT_14871 [Oculimacula yallundae]|uniref:Uncharacterized protein n=1 Tax=Oculimacula yallundae TaxID=86028 RepID=A0ABR4CEZ6_9HELO